MTQTKMCIFRVRCQRGALSYLTNEIIALINKDFDSFGRSMPDGLICYFAGLPQNAQGGTRHIMYKDDNTSQISFLERFAVAENQKIRFELVVEKEDDLTAIQYLLLSIHALVANGINYEVLISGRRKNHVNTPLNENDYYRISHTLYFYLALSDTQDALPGLSEKVRAYVHTKGEPRLQRLARYYKNKRSPSLGRIVPIIPVTIDSRAALSVDYVSKTAATNVWCDLLGQLCLDYFARIKCHSPLKDKISSLIVRDSYLDALVFLSMSYFVSEREELSAESIISLHELSMDFSQGIAQLMDNIVNHVLGNNGQNGMGVFTMRIRKKEDALTLYLKDESKLSSDVHYFMELYLVDIQYNGFKGIVEKFIENVKTRKNIAQTLEEWQPQAEFYYSQLPEDVRKIELEQESPERQDIINKYLGRFWGSQHYNVGLSSFFGADPCRPLSDYLTNRRNIAFHYGLSIIHSLLLSQEGYLYVQSGVDESKNCFCNADNRKYQVIDNMAGNHGTSYILCFPIRETIHSGPLEPLAISNGRNDMEYIHEPFELKDGLVFSKGKEAAVQELADVFTEFFNVQKQGEKSIGVLRCDRLVKHLDFSRLDAYEVITKAIFLYLASPNSTVHHIALVNIEYQYDVIKLFRLFALFFDRNGKNSHLGNTSLFLVDQSGAYDILLQGDSLNSILSNLSFSRLYGGASEEVIQIIRALLAGRESNGN